MTELYCDVAVVGGGPAGIAAAVSAAEAGASVVLVDEAPLPGGQIWRHTTERQLPDRARDWLDRLRSARVTTLNNASVFDAEVLDLCTLYVDRQQIAERVRSERLVLATGARELFLPFPGWTLPGVVGVGGVQALLKSGFDARGRRVLIGGSGPLLFPVAAMLAAAGADVIEVLEQAARGRLVGFGATLWRTPRRVLEAFSYRRAFARAPFRTGTWVVRAEGSARVERAVVSDGARTHTRTLDCDMLCVSYGLVPASGLARHIGCAVDDTSRVNVDENQMTTIAGVYCAGETTGIAGVDAALVEGTIAGVAAAGGTPSRALLRRAMSGARFVQTLARAFEPRDELRVLARADTVICRCEDVTWARLQRCGSMREAKLVTRAGMGPCQGRICGTALQCMTGWQPDSVRAPVIPARMDAMREQ